MSTEKKANKVDIDSANAEFDRFVECMDLDLDTSAMDSEDFTQFNKLKSKIIRAVMKGSLIFNDNGEAIYQPQNKRSKYQEPITFHERSGASLMAMDGKKKNHDVSKTYAVMGEMCRVHQKVFAGLVGVDVKICEALFALLMD